MRLIITFTLLIFFSACQTETVETASNLKEDYFFDLKSYIEGEIAKLNKQQPQIEKSIQLRGKTEIQQFDSLDYKKELSVFSQADINKAAWTDKYKADTLYEQGTIVKISYQAIDNSLKTNLLEISFTNDNVSHIYVKAITESLVANVYKEMNYWPGKGYQLASSQSTVLSDTTAVAIDAQFLE